MQTCQQLFCPLQLKLFSSTVAVFILGSERAMLTVGSVSKTKTEEAAASPIASKPVDGGGEEAAASFDPKAKELPNRRRPDSGEIFWKKCSCRPVGDPEKI